MRKLEKLGTWSRTFLLLSVLCFFAICAQAQTVSGVVKDQNGDAVIGATVKIVGSKTGTVTDAKGHYSIEASNGSILSVSYVGYLTKQMRLRGENVVDIVLMEDNTTLNDLVVIGYGVQKKSDLTGAVGSVKGEDIARVSTNDLGSALQGKAAGLQVINSGSPGKGAAIRVRGYSSNSDKIDPLYIVDGLKVDNIQYLDPSIIERVEVLKDAASAAIYGAAAGNGVVLITTKQGKEGSASISYDLKATLQSLGKKADLFNAADYIEYHKYLGDLTDDELSKKYNGQDTDWYDEVFDNSWGYTHTITAQGGNDKGHFLAALNIVDNDGIVKGNKDVYKRFGGQVNADYKLYEWFNISTSNSIEKWNTKSVGNGYASFLNSVVSIDPLTSPYVNSIEDMGMNMADRWNSDPVTHGNVMVAPDGSWYGTSKYIEDATANPLAMRDRIDRQEGGFNIRGNVTANIIPVKPLTITSRLGYRIAQRNVHEYNKPWWLSSMAHSENYTLTAENYTSYYYMWENFANFNKTFGKFSVGAMAGMSFTKNSWDDITLSSSDTKQILSGDGIPSYRYMSYLLSDAPRSVGNNPDTRYETAYFGRLSLSYDDRYFLQFNMRSDAADLHKVSKSARWGNFPSLSAGWTISNESFFKNAISEKAVSFLKFRGSWGRNGVIQTLDDWKYSASIGVGGYYMFQPSLNNGTLVNGAKTSVLPNEDLHWETSEQTDFGIDARFLSNRLSFTFDYFNKITKDLLLNLTPLPELGATSYWQNTGKVQNRGLEFELGWKDKIGDLNYSITTNFSTIDNEVKEVNDLVARITGTGITGFNSQLAPTFEKDHTIWYFRGYKWVGNNEKGEPLYWHKEKDGSITETTSPTPEDKFDLGSAIPTFTYGINISLEYKGIDLMVNGVGASGNKIYNLMVSADRNRINGINTYWKDSYRTDASGQVLATGKYPDMKKVSTSWIFFSSNAAIHDGSFFKFKQIQLGYTLPKNITTKAGINQLRFSVSLDDYFTITSYPGADPETSSLNNGQARGFDNGNYPMSKKVVFGLNLAF